MSYEDLLISPLLYLPFPHDGLTLKSSLEKLLTSFLTEIEKLEDGPLNIDQLPDINGQFVKSVQKQFTKGLLETIDIYHQGRPATAYQKLADTLNNNLKNFEEVLKIRSYEQNESFFRMRVEKGNFPLSRVQMFHIPFELRGIIKTQRYSIPGFPCLYLGRTLYGCWEEMSRPDINEFQAVRLKNIRQIKFLDLTRPQYDDDLRSRDLYHYLMTWPLIACCSAKVRDYSRPFKSEYIIPQLLLQWIRDRQTLDGIKFNSTHIDFHKTGSKGDFSNLVLPVKENAESGYCPQLKSIFEITNPISWQMHQHSVGGQISVPCFGSETQGVNNRISKLELIEGRPYPYSFSVLGQLESFLDMMPTFPLTD